MNKLTNKKQINIMKTNLKKVLNQIDEEDEDFIKGLKFFLNKDTITKDDIDNIYMEYQDQLTIFSLCM